MAEDVVQLVDLLPAERSLVSLPVLDSEDQLHLGLRHRDDVRHCGLLTHDVVDGVVAEAGCPLLVADVDAGLGLLVREGGRIEGKEEVALALLLESDLHVLALPGEPEGELLEVDDAVNPGEAPGSQKERKVWLLHDLHRDGQSPDLAVRVDQVDWELHLAQARCDLSTTELELLGGLLVPEGGLDEVGVLAPDLLVLLQASDGGQGPCVQQHLQLLLVLLHGGVLVSQEDLLCDQDSNIVMQRTTISEDTGLSTGTYLRLLSSRAMQDQRRPERLVIILLCWSEGSQPRHQNIQGDRLRSVLDPGDLGDEGGLCVLPEDAVQLSHVAVEASLW